MNKCPHNYDYVLNTFWILHIVDYLICNTRSAGNIGFFHGKEIVLAPIYDCETRLINIKDQSYKDTNYPSLHMDFGLDENSCYYIFKELNDANKDYALEYARKHLNIAGIKLESGVKEEKYMLDVISYRYDKLFK